MNDETATSETISADDWGAAMAEQATSEPATSEPATSAATAADDWGAAMAEQAKPHAFEQLGASGAGTTQNDLDMILDIPVQLSVELGRTKMPIKNLLQLAQGSVVELAGMAGEPLDVMINGFLIAQGEVVVVNDKLGIRLTDIITPSERLRRLNR